MHQLTHLVSQKEQIDFLFAQEAFLHIAKDVLSDRGRAYSELLSIPTTAFMTICNYRTSAFELHKALHEPTGNNYLPPTYIFALMLRLEGDADLAEFQNYVMQSILADKTLITSDSVADDSAWMHTGWIERFSAFIKRRTDYDVNEGIFDQPTLLEYLEDAADFTELCTVLLMTYDSSDVMDHGTAFFDDMFGVFEKRFSYTFAAYENHEDEFTHVLSAEKVEVRYPLVEYLNRHASINSKHPTSSVTLFNPARGGGFSCMN